MLLVQFHVLFVNITDIQHSTEHHCGNRLGLFSKENSHFTTWIFTSFAFHMEYCAKVLPAKFNKICVPEELFDKN